MIKRMIKMTMRMILRFLVLGFLGLRLVLIGFIALGFTALSSPSSKLKAWTGLRKSATGSMVLGV